MTRLNAEAMGEIATKVFRDRTTTLSEAGEAYEMDELTSAVRAVRRMLRSSLESLPETAFAAQPAADGDVAWSAGQVIAHIGNAQTSMSGAVRSLLDMPEAAEGVRYDMEQIPSRGEALAILARAEAEFDAFVAETPADADLSKTMRHERFGEMSGKGWMLLMALHEADHLRQVRTLA